MASHQRHGHLLQGRYGAVLVERDAYLLRLSRYVHLNPVFTTALRRRPSAARLAVLRQYPWSSYRSYIGQDRRRAWVDYAPILATVGAPGTRQGRERGHVLIVNYSHSQFSRIGVPRFASKSDHYASGVREPDVA